LLGDSESTPVGDRLAVDGVVAPALGEALQLAAQAGRWHLAEQLAEGLFNSAPEGLQGVVADVVALAANAGQWRLVERLSRWVGRGANTVDLAGERARRGAK
jgi:hypothetical protein